MARQPFPDEAERTEELLRILGPNVTIGLEPTEAFLSGEVYTIHKMDGAEVFIGQGGTLIAACEDLYSGMGDL